MIPHISASIKRLFKDAANLNLLTDEGLKKLKCELRHGGRVYWYYKEDADFAKEEDLNVRKMEYYSGLVIGFEDNEAGSLEPWDCMIVMDRYPCEKENPQITWISINTLLADENLVEVYEES